MKPLLDTHIQQLVDVRSLPGSRRSPQFNRELMQEWVPGAGITYLHMAELGGRRKNQAANPEINAGWNNDSFRHYADYTLTDAYKQAIVELENIAKGLPTVIMCGEPVPWRCHRSIIADTLVNRGWTVTHILHGAAPINHVLGKWGAQPVPDALGNIIYPKQVSSPQ